MAGILIRQRRTFFSPAAGRHYLCPRAAARAEARCQMKGKYPDERSVYENGMSTPGFTFTESEELVEVYNRLYRALLRKLRANIKLSAGNPWHD